MAGTGIINSISPFGRYLKIKLMEINKTQAWLSQHTGICKTTISQMTRGDRAFPEKEKIVRAFLEKYQGTA